MRIAGVDVGKVKTVEAAGGRRDAAVVTMEINKHGLPIHKDATAKIRPRIFLEGNFFVDLKPGTPARAELDDGDTIKITSTATPVQLDEVLTALQSDTREDLGRPRRARHALNSKPTPAEDADADPSARGRPRQSFNDAYDDIPAAERSTAIVNEAFLGTEPGKDLVAADRRARRKATGALGRNEEQLKDLVTDFNRTTARVRRPSGQPAAPRSASWGRRSRRANGALASSTRRSRRRARSRARSCPACARRRRRSTPGFPWIAPDAQAASPRPSCAGSPRSCRRPRATSRA